MKVKNTLAFSQIGLLVIAIFAIAFIFSEVGIVHGQDIDQAQLNRLKKGALDSKTSSPLSVTGTGSGSGSGLARTHDISIDSDGGLVITPKDVVGGVVPGPGDPHTYDGILGSEYLKLENPIGGHLIEGFNWALGAVTAIQVIGRIAGLDEGQVNALSVAAASGILAGKAVYGIAKATIAGTEYVYGGGEFSFGGESFLKTGLTKTGFTVTLIGVGVALFVLSEMYKTEKQTLHTFQCLPWEAPEGGAKCEECNKDEFRTCSEYRCKSLGQACELVNVGSEEEKCVWVNPRDVNSPTITTWEEALSDGHSYVPHATRPTSLGTNVVLDESTNGCIRAFTPLEFGVETNEPAQCKIDFVHTETFEEMTFFVGESNFFKNNHTQKMSLPSPDSTEGTGIVIGADGNYDFYVRCKDKNGNENVDEFVFSLCVDPSPDTTPPLIVDTSILPDSPVAFGIGEIEMSLFVNEPSECSWSINDKAYDEMENEMSCSTSLIEQNARQLYECETTLTGIKDREDNQYYFRCKDQPNKPDEERNENVQSFAFNLRGTQELSILEVGPNGTISESTNFVNVDLTVETSNGADEGKAICYFSPSGNEGSYVLMFETDSFEHKQSLTLPAAEYEFFFRCIDAGGNFEEAQTNFEVFVDTQAPLITRAYKEGADALKVVTNEDAECAYSLNNCNYVFEEGLALINSDPDSLTVHFAEWQPNNVYYIKCRDEFGNQPSPDQCSLVASATNII